MNNSNSATTAFRCRSSRPRLQTMAAGKKKLLTRAGSALRVTPTRLQLPPLSLVSAAAPNHGCWKEKVVNASWVSLTGNSNSATTACRCRSSRPRLQTMAAGKKKLLTRAPLKLRVHGFCRTERRVANSTAKVNLLSMQVTPPARSQSVPKHTVNHDRRVALKLRVHGFCRTERRVANSTAKVIF
jgi:hypothetical protein